jgi:hypothetical protein
MADGSLVSAVLYEKWRLSSPLEPSCGRRLETATTGHWLKTVVSNVVGKGATGSRQAWTGKMSDEREFCVVDVSKSNWTASKPRSHRYFGKSLGDIRLVPR